MENGKVEVVEHEWQVSDLGDRLSAKPAQEIQNEPHVWVKKNELCLAHIALKIPTENIL